MPRLLLVSTVPSFITAFLLPFARHFQQLGWHVDAMANGIASDQRCKTSFEHLWNIGWSRNPCTTGNLFTAPSRVRAIVDAEQYDIVHVHTPVAGFVCRYSLRSLNLPVKIYTAHGFHFHEHGTKLSNLIFRQLEKAAGAWTDYLVVINRRDEAAALEHRLISPDRIIYMQGIGLDLQHTYNPACVNETEVQTFRQDLQLASDDEILLSIAEFIPRKRHSDLLHAFARLARPRAHLVLAGAGPLMSGAKKLAQRLGVAARVHFLGLRRDVPVLIRSAKVVLLCSEQEGLPRSVMEALALEVPVVASDIRGTRELLEASGGYLYKLGDVGGLCRVTKWVLDHPLEAAATARAGRERMDPYDIARILNSHEQLYTRALATRQRSYSVLR